MVRVRKLALAIAAASALSSGMVHALGVGELTLRSALNQPLLAEIELLDVRDLSSDEVRPILASHEEFSKAGVERQYFLTDLKFTSIVKANGKSFIRVTSSKPIREPYLNFLVDVLWPSGRLLREYTLLLDPPLYSVAPPPPIRSFTNSARSAQPVVAPAQAPAAAAASKKVSVAAVTQKTGDLVAGGEYRTQRNDTLWSIAERVRGNGSVNQAMLAIQDLNPEAFIDGNINRMKKAQALRLPDAQQIAKRSQAEALAQVNQQNSDWRQGRVTHPVTPQAQQIDATQSSVGSATTDQAGTKDSLKLLAADTEQAVDSTGASEGNGTSVNDALQNQLAIAKEGLDSARRENDEFKARMDDLQSQVDKLQRLMQLKDEQLVKLQAELTARPVTAQSTTDVAQDDGLLSSWSLLGLFGGSAVLALLALLFWSRRNGQYRREPLGESSLPQTEVNQRFAVDLTPAFAAAEQSSLSPEAEPVVEQPLAVKTKDALGEADIYIAYGRFDHAAELLQKAVADEPERVDLRLKLMEVYAEQKNSEGFSQQEQALARFVGAQEGIARLKNRYPLMAVPAATSTGPALVDEELDAAALDDLQLDDLLLDDPVEPINQVPEETFDFDALSLGEELERDSQPLNQPAPLPADNDHLVLGSAADVQSAPVAELELPEVGFDLDLNEQETLASPDAEFLPSLQDDAQALTADASASANESELLLDDDFDLSSDFDLSLEDESQPSEQGEPVRDFANQLDEVVAELDQLSETIEQPLAADISEAKARGLDDLDDLDDLDFLAGTDETATKLDLARAYIDMGDTEGARDILGEVIAEGNEAQQQEARELIGQLV